MNKTALCLVLLNLILSTLVYSQEDFPFQNTSIIVRGDHHYPPYEYLDKGEPTGFNVEVFKAVAEVMGISYSISLGPWNEVRKNLERKEIDALTGMYFSEERNKVVDFTNAHILVSHSFFSRLDLEDTVLNDISGKVVFVQKGDLMHDYLRNKHPEARVAPVNNPIDALRRLSAEEGDLALLAKLQGLYLINRYGLANLKNMGDSFMPREYCFALRKGNVYLQTQLNEGLKIIKATGKYKDIYNRWFGIYDEKPEFYYYLKKYYLFIVPIFIMLIVILIWNVSISRSVAKKTAALKRELIIKEQMEKSLKKSEKRFRRFFDLGLVGMGILSEEMQWIYINDQMTNILGYNKNELRELTWIDLIVDKTRADYRFYQKMKEQSSNYYFSEKTFKHQKGRHVYANIIIRKDELLGHYLVLLEDITARKKVEKKLEETKRYLKNIVDSMPSVLIGFDLEGKINQWNHAAEMEFNLDQNEAMGMNIFDIIDEEKDLSSKIMDNILRGENFLLEKYESEKNNKKYYKNLIAYPIRNDQLEGGVLRMDDITDKVYMEAMMIQTEKMMTVGGLAAGMAHEINNPLGIILQSIQNAFRRLDPEKNGNSDVAEEIGVSLDLVNEYLERRKILRFLQGIRDAGERAAAIVKNMLNFSRPGSSKMVIDNINSIIEKSVQLAENDYNLKKKYDFKNIRLEKKLQRNMRQIPCVPNELEQVLFNILKNAAQALIEKKDSDRDFIPEIVIKTKQDVESTRIFIQDNGPGMAKEIRKHAFEPFFTTKEPGVGTGLGLSVSYYIITTNHKGNIEVDSDAGWTRFTIALPNDQLDERPYQSFML